MRGVEGGGVGLRCRFSHGEVQRGELGCAGLGRAEQGGARLGHAEQGRAGWGVRGWGAAGLVSGVVGTCCRRWGLRRGGLVASRCHVAR